MLGKQHKTSLLPFLAELIPSFSLRFFTVLDRRASVYADHAMRAVISPCRFFVRDRDIVHGAVYGTIAAAVTLVCHMKFFGAERKSADGVQHYGQSFALGCLIVEHFARKDVMRDFLDLLSCGRDQLLRFRLRRKGSANDIAFRHFHRFQPVEAEALLFAKFERVIDKSRNVRRIRGPHQRASWRCPRSSVESRGDRPSLPKMRGLCIARRSPYRYTWRTRCTP